MTSVVLEKSPQVYARTGVGYIAFSLAQMLAPAFAATVLFPWIMLPAFLMALGLALWLLVKGVDLPKWEQRTRACGAAGTGD